jgi:hypothetical protein
MESIAKFFNHDFSKGYFELFDKNGNIVYSENPRGSWCKLKYDNNGNKIYYEDSYGHWSKCEYDKNNNEIYYEDSYGNIKDNRPKCNVKTVIIEGIEYELRRVK